jgi:hypothetical protein
MRETRVVALFWLALVVASLFGVPGARWLLLALILSHLFQAVWLTTEHTGLPYEGTILARTRTMLPAAWVRWWLWNMNYHAEHHAWPAIPWHALPAVHERVAPSSIIKLRGTGSCSSTCYGEALALEAVNSAFITTEEDFSRLHPLLAVAPAARFVMNARSSLFSPSIVREERQLNHVHSSVFLIKYSASRLRYASPWSSP